MAVMGTDEYDLSTLLNPALLGSGGGGGDSEDENDPRTRMLRLMSLSAMRQLGGQPDEANADTISHMTPDQASDSGMIPAGYDESTHLPTEFPATANKAAAATRLQKASQFNQPQGLKRDAFKALLTAAPALIGLAGHSGAASAGAAAGANAGAQLVYNRGLQERQFAEGQYQFEATQEQQQRDMAIREMLAMSQLQANKAYRTLMASIASRRADTGADNAAVNANSNGLKVVTGENGERQVVPITKEQMSTLNQARLGVEQAQQDLANARTKAIPEQIEIAKKRLDLQSKMLQKALAELGLQQWRAEMERERLDFQETGPTVTTRNRAQQARTVPEHLDEFDQQVTEAEQRGYIGPAAGRVYSEFLAGKVGTTGDPEADRFLGNMRTNAKFLTGAALLTHFNGRGISLYGNFENILSAKNSAGILHGDVDQFKKYMERYGAMDQWTPIGGRAAGPGNPAARLKRGQGGSSAGNPPAGARVRDYTQVGAGVGAGAR